MIDIDKVVVTGWEAAIRGMRNPMNSWESSDSTFVKPVGGVNSVVQVPCLDIGPKDKDLMAKLAKAGPTHAKYRRMIIATMDITAPLYWWKEFDTYKVGTVANSCSTMHKIGAKEFELDDFSHDHLYPASESHLMATVGLLNYWRDIWTYGGFVETGHNGNMYYDKGSKDAWWQMIQLLPSSYNQKRTVQLSYENLYAICRDRKGHKLDEWNVFIKRVEALCPYSWIFRLGEEGDHET